MHKEIEIKIQITDQDLLKLQNWFHKSATYKGQSKQIDYYFNKPDDQFFLTYRYKDKQSVELFLKKYEGPLEYLRIRKNDYTNSICLKKSYVNFKTRTPLYAQEYEVIVDDCHKTIELVKTLGYIETAIVEKIRNNYYTNRFKIAIDEVKKLGVFVEIELNYEVESIDLGHKLIYRFLKSVGIHTCKIPKQGYPNMIWNPNIDFSQEIIL